MHHPPNSVETLRSVAYAWMYDSGPGLQVEGFEWILVGLAVLIDLGSLFGGSRGRR